MLETSDPVIHSGQRRILFAAALRNGPFSQQAFGLVIGEMLS